MSELSLEKQNVSLSGKVQRLVVPVFFALAGLLIGFITYLPSMDSGLRFAFKLGTPVVMLITSVLCYRFERYRPYWQIAYSFFAISIGVLVANYTGELLPRLFSLSLDTISGIAVAKLVEVISITVPILILIWVAKYNRASVYLTVGKFKSGLIIGLGTFLCLGIIASLQAAGLGVSRGKFIQAIPWMLIFALSNGFMEELWFRALFLKKLETVMKPVMVLLLTTVVFALVHIDVTYVSPSEMLTFMAELFALGFLFGLVMKKTQSIFAAVLFHAGADLLVLAAFLGAF